MLPQHFTNIQHSLQLARRFLATKDTPNRQVILITDGLPTAHLADNWLYMNQDDNRRRPIRLGFPEVELLTWRILAIGEIGHRWIGALRWRLFLAEKRSRR